MGNNIILETKFVADISGSFYIPSYQRGYRWSETEVVRLLDDIYQNGKKNYCLQPVVVRKKEDQYELIDGQQRLTTLYLIYKYMKNVNPFFNEPAFTLSYQTRDQSEEFLKTLDMTKQDDNIDFWFISKAYNTIKEWFEQDLQIRVMHIFEYLKEDVKIIWYEVGESEDAISLFTRLNIGKIPLTSAELVKAMFLSRDNAEKKYPVFRPGSYGKMSNDDVVNKPYMFSVMQTKTQWSQNTYMPYLKEADDDHLSRDEMGQYLVYDDVYIVCENNSYGVYRNDDSLTDTVTISQNEAGIDTEDRIIKLKKYIANMK